MLCPTNLNPPIELTEFVPEKIEVGFVRTWELKTSDFDDNVEIRNTVFVRPMKTIITLMVAWMTLIGGIGITATIMTDHPVLPGGVPPMVAKALLVAFAGNVLNLWHCFFVQESVRFIL